MPMVARIAGVLVVAHTPARISSASAPELPHHHGCRSIGWEVKYPTFTPGSRTSQHLEWLMLFSLCPAALITFRWLVQVTMPPSSQGAFLMFWVLQMLAEDEVWIRYLSILVATLASCGHLMSLQGSASAIEALVNLGCYFEFPEMMLAQILIRVLASMTRFLLKRERLPIRFVLAACLGMHASSETSPKRTCSLITLQPHQVVRVQRKISILWIGRLGLLLAFLAQYIGTVSIWIRGVFHVQDRGIWFWYIDLRTFRIAIGGLMATLNSIMILLHGSEWKLLDLSDHNVGPGRVERSDTSSTLCDETDEFVKTHAEEQHSLKCEPKSSSGFAAFLCVRYKALDSMFTQRLDHVFPALRQSDLELGIVIHRVWVYGITVYNSRYRFLGGCPSIVRFLAEASSTFDWTQACQDRTDIWDATAFSLSPRQRDHTKHGELLQISNLLFNIGVGRILAQWVFTVLAQLYEKMWKPGPGRLRSLGQAVFSGRSILSFPFLLLLFSCGPATIVLLLENRGWIQRAQTMLQNSATGEMDRLAMSVLSWKDPWHDSLYLI